MGSEEAGRLLTGAGVRMNSQCRQQTGDEQPRSPQLRGLGVGQWALPRSVRFEVPGSGGPGPWLTAAEGF